MDVILVRLPPLRTLYWSDCRHCGHYIGQTAAIVDIILVRLSPLWTLYWSDCRHCGHYIGQTVAIVDIILVRLSPLWTLYWSDCRHCGHYIGQTVAIVDISSRLIARGRVHNFPVIKTRQDQPSVWPYSGRVWPCQGQLLLHITLSRVHRLILQEALAHRKPVFKDDYFVISSVILIHLSSWSLSWDRFQHVFSWNTCPYVSSITWILNYSSNFQF